VAADLVTLAEFDAWLGGAVTAEDSMRTALLEQVEALLERACGRESVPFVAAQTARVEVRDGTGSRELWLDYPIADVTTIAFSDDAATTLDPDDADVVRWKVGSRRLTRVDGGVFGCFSSPLLVTVTYNAAADLPADAKVAVLRMATQLYNHKGSEGYSSETMGPYSWTLAKGDAMESDIVWQSVVATHMRAVV
jgi:hypothetical protein